MSQTLANLVRLLKPEQLDHYLFRAQSEELGLPQVFGGQVLAQALLSAQKTVEISQYVHSFHSYFLRPGDSHRPIFYHTEILRNGKSLSTRRVKAVQQGEPIFYMTASFQAEEQGYTHQSTMPEVEEPHHLFNEQQLIKQLGDKLPPSIVEIFGRECALEIRPVQIFNPFKGHKAEPVRQIWIRTSGTLAEEQSLHQALLSYASDFNFLAVSLQPHGRGILEPGLQAATIDHSMWFHRPVNLNEWILYDIISPSASGNRGFVRGEFYNQRGELVASAVQEGVIRQR